MRPDLTGRLACVRLHAAAEAHTVAARSTDDTLTIVVAGSIGGQSADVLYTTRAIQPEGGAGCGFVTMLAGKAGGDR